MKKIGKRNGAIMLKLWIKRGEMLDQNAARNVGEVVEDGSAGYGIEAAMRGVLSSWKKNLDVGETGVISACGL